MPRTCPSCWQRGDRRALEVCAEAACYRLMITDSGVSPSASTLLAVDLSDFAWVLLALVPGAMLILKDKAREWDGERVAQHLASYRARGLLQKAGFVVVLIAVFALGWWLTTQSAARTLDRAMQEHAEAFRLSRDRRDPRTKPQMAAVTALREAESRYEKDFALGLGVGLAADVLLLAGVVLWQRLRWQQPTSPPQSGDVVP